MAKNGLVPFQWALDADGTLWLHLYEGPGTETQRVGKCTRGGRGELVLSGDSFSSERWTIREGAGGKRGATVRIPWSLSCTVRGDQDAAAAPSLGCVRRSVGLQASLSLGFLRREHGRGSPLPPPGHLPHPGIEPASPRWQADSWPLSHQGSPLVKMCLFTLCAF